MFMECSSLEELPDISKWEIIKYYNKDIIESIIFLFSYYKDKLSNIEFDIAKINDFISSFFQFNFQNIIYRNKFSHCIESIKSFDDILSSFPGFKFINDKFILSKLFKSKVLFKNFKEKKRTISSIF